MQAINFGRPVALSEMKMGQYYFAIADRTGSVSIGKRTRKPKHVLDPTGLVWLNDAGSIFVDRTGRFRSTKNKKPYTIQQYSEENFVFFEVPANVTSTPEGFIDADLRVVS
jgi:hypothetical protein